MGELVKAFGPYFLVVLGVGSKLAGVPDLYVGAIMGVGLGLINPAYQRPQS